MGVDMIDLIRKQSDYLENVEWRFEEMLALIKIIPQDLKESNLDFVDKALKRWE